MSDPSQNDHDSAPCRIFIPARAFSYLLHRTILYNRYLLLYKPTTFNADKPTQERHHCPSSPLVTLTEQDMPEQEEATDRS